VPEGQIQASQSLTNFVLFKRCLGSQVHGKLNTHTGDAHGIAQLKRKFFPEVCESNVGFMLVLCWRPHVAYVNYRPLVTSIVYLLLTLVTVSGFLFCSC
jgi:hypothetical protein